MSGDVMPVIAKSTRRPDEADLIHANDHWQCEGCLYHHNGDRRDECECVVPEVSECPVLLIDLYAEDQ